MRRLALAEHPQAHAADIDRGVVIARDLPAIPPPGLDPLRLAEQPQRPPPPWQPVALVKCRGTGNSHEGERDSRRFPQGRFCKPLRIADAVDDRLPYPPRRLRPMILNDLEGHTPPPAPAAPAAAR